MTFELLALGEVEPDFVSRRIQAAIGANYSHIAVLVDGYQIYHAIGKGICKSVLPQLLADGPCVIRRRIQIPVERDCCALMWLNSKVGIRYSNAQYPGFVIPALRFLPGVNNGKAQAVCSEFGADFVAECSTKGAIAMMAYVDTDFVDPKQCCDVAAGIYGEPWRG